MLKGMLEDIIDSLDLDDFKYKYTLRKLCARFHSAKCIGEAVLSMHLKSYLQWVMEYIHESQIESKWFWWSGMTYINIVQAVLKTRFL